jgi:hypothetical protein
MRRFVTYFDEESGQIGFARAKRSNTPSEHLYWGLKSKALFRVYAAVALVIVLFLLLAAGNYVHWQRADIIL